MSELVPEGPDLPLQQPTLVVLPDPEATGAARRPVLGITAAGRLSAGARRAGFGSVLVASGSDAQVAGAREAGDFDPLEGPGLVAYDTATIHQHLLELMVAHPLDEDESFTLYDEAGRPTATFVGELTQVPSSLPICEELPYPEGLGASDVVRFVYPEDRARAQALVFESEQVFPRAASWWRQWVGAPSLRMLAGLRGPMAQLELVCLVLVGLALPLTVVGAWPLTILGAVCLLAGVHLSKLLKSVRILRRAVLREPGDPAGERLARATRPLGHAAIGAGLTYALLAGSDRADIADLILLAAGAGATLIALIQARLLLRGHDQPVFALPDAHAVFARLGLPVVAAIEGAPLFELVVLVCACSTSIVVPWSVVVLGAAARLWRWYAGPIGAAGD